MSDLAERPPVMEHVVGVVDNPFARPAAPSHISAGAVAIESERAIAEAQGKMVVAKRFPRDTMMAAARILEACKRPSLAKGAIYSYSRGGTVSGPSIRLAEEMARCWGNIEYGLRELSQKDGFSEMEAFAWDLETNVRSSQAFTVRHIRDKKADKGGPEALKDQRDIYEITANMGSRRVRARLLAVLPADLVSAAVEQCRLTMKNGNDRPLADRIREAVQAFGQIGVTPAMLATRLGHPLDQMTPDELVDFEGVHCSISDGVSKVADHFNPELAGAPVQGGKLDRLESALAKPGLDEWPYLRGGSLKLDTDASAPAWLDSCSKIVNGAPKAAALETWAKAMEPHFKAVAAVDADLVKEVRDMIEDRLEALAIQGEAT